MAELVAPKMGRWAELRCQGRVRGRIEERNARRCGAVVLVRKHHDRERGLGPQEAVVLGRRGLPVGAERAQDRSELVLEPATGLAQRGDAAEHILDGAGVVGLAAGVQMYVAPGVRPVALHVPRGVYWKIPFLPPGERPFESSSQPAMPPAPMSCDTTAM